MPREQRERVMLDVAGQVFARHGYHSASMDEIAELSGVSKPMLYAYFGSKEGLYVAYVHRAGNELLERLVATPARGESPGARLRHRIEEFLAFVEEHRDGWVVLYREVSSSRPLADELSQLRGQIAQAVRRMLEAGASGLPGPAADGIAHAIVGAGESLANWWLDHPDVPRSEVADWYLEVVRAADLRNRRPVADRVPSAPHGAQGDSSPG
jgi:AcrR family transcriptional regulator